MQKKERIYLKGILGLKNSTDVCKYYLEASVYELHFSRFLIVIFMMSKIPFKSKKPKNNS